MNDTTGGVRRFSGDGYGVDQRRPTMRPAPQQQPAPDEYEWRAGEPVPGLQREPRQAPSAPAVSHAAAEAAQGRPVEPLAAADGVVELSRAYENGGEPVRAIRFREPTTADLRRIGYPLRNVLGPDGRVTGIDELPDRVARYITDLSEPKVLPSTIDKFSLDDFSRCSGIIIGFFLG